MGSNATSELIPDRILADAFFAEVERLRPMLKRRIGRDVVVERQESIAMIRQALGPRYAHVSDDTLRYRILLCAKNPDRHDGWDRTVGHGPLKGHKQRTEIDADPEYEQYLRSDLWQHQRAIIHQRDGHRCKICNTKRQLETHHRCYRDDLGRFLGGTRREINECVTLCRRCHRLYHDKIEGLPDDTLF